MGSWSLRHPLDSLFIGGGFGAEHGFEYLCIAFYYFDPKDGEKNLASKRGGYFFVLKRKKPPEMNPVAFLLKLMAAVLTLPNRVRSGIKAGGRFLVKRNIQIHLVFRSPIIGREGGSLVNGFAFSGTKGIGHRGAENEGRSRARFVNSDSKVEVYGIRNQYNLIPK